MPVTAKENWARGDAARGTRLDLVSGRDCPGEDEFHAMELL